MTSVQEAEAVVRGETAASITVDGRYEQALAAGDYLFCLLNFCTSVAVSNGEVTTVNVNVGDGIVIFYVFEPGEDLRVSDNKTWQFGENSMIFYP